MTTGSPVADSVSGPGVADTNAICLPSGDHTRASPAPGSGWFVLIVGARNVASLPSGRITMTPDFSPSEPRNASHLPSGDQRGCRAARSSSCLLLLPATSVIHTREDAPRAPSRVVTAYAICEPSGEMLAPSTDLIACRSWLVK